jgi:hypothetical protein
MASVLHHLCADASSVLALLARIVRRRLVVLDLDPSRQPGSRAFLIANDRGHFVRPAARQRVVLEEHFASSPSRSRTACARRCTLFPRAAGQRRAAGEPGAAQVHVNRRGRAATWPIASVPVRAARRSNRERRP